MHKSLSLVYTNRRRQKEEEALYEIFNFFAGRTFSLRAAKRESTQGGRGRGKREAVGSAAAHTNIERK